MAERVGIHETFGGLRGVLVRCIDRAWQISEAFGSFVDVPRVDPGGRRSVSPINLAADDGAGDAPGEADAFEG